MSQQAQAAQAQQQREAQQSGGFFGALGSLLPIVKHFIP